MYDLQRRIHDPRCQNKLAADLAMFDIQWRKSIYYSIVRAPQKYHVHKGHPSQQWNQAECHDLSKLPYQVFSLKLEDGTMELVFRAHAA